MTTVLCAWCQKVIKVVVEDFEFEVNIKLQRNLTSHGICPDCLVAMEADIDGDSGHNVNTFV